MTYSMLPSDYRLIVQILEDCDIVSDIQDFRTKKSENFRAHRNLALVQNLPHPQTGVLKYNIMHMIGNSI